jgi:hypothetical protein
MAAAARWGLFLFRLLGGGLLVLSGEAPAGAERGVMGSVFWPVPLTTTGRMLVPFGDGRHVWVVDERGVFAVDQTGVRTHARGSWLPPGFTVSDLLQTERPGRAWVIAHSTMEKESGSQVYLVDAGDGEVKGRTVLMAERVVPLREQLFRSPFDVVPQAALPKDLTPHARVWLVLRRSGEDLLAVLDADGDVEPVSSLAALGVPGDADSTYWQVIPVGEGPKAWLKTNRHVFFLDARSQSPVLGPLLEAERNIWVVPGPDGSQAWVMAEVCSGSPFGIERRLYWIDATAPRGPSYSPLLNRTVIRQVVVAASGVQVWITGALNPGAGWEGGLQLVDARGRQVLPGGVLFRGQRVLVSSTRSGHVWALTESGGAYLLDDEGKVLAGGPEVLSGFLSSEEGFFDFIMRPSGPEGLLLQGRTVMHLRVDSGEVRATPLLEGGEALLVDAESEAESAWVYSIQDGKLYFVSLSKERYLESHFVLTASDVSYVIPAREELHGWIQAEPASIAYVPLSQVNATLALQGGALRVEGGRRIELIGALDLRAPLRGSAGDSVDLVWPGRAHAAEVGGVLNVELWDASRPKSPVASVTRRYAPGAPHPELNWNLDAPAFGERSYIVTFRYQDAVGTHTELLLHDIRFRSPLLGQIWFRTAVACLVATLLFVLPIVFLSRTRLARRWLPFVSWSANILGGGGFALTGLARSLRIHFPSFVGVLLCEMLLCLVAGAFSPAVFRVLASIKPFQWLVPLALDLPPTRRRVLTEEVAHVRRKLEAWRRQANDEQYVSIAADIHEEALFSSSPDMPKRTALLMPFCPCPEERICGFLVSERQQGGNVLIESPGGRGKSALLREVVRRMLLAFEEDPSRPLPLLCDARSATLEEAAFRALESNPLPRDIQEVLLEQGAYFLVMDGLTESALGPEAVHGFIEGRYGGSVRLLLTSRPHLGFRQAVASSERWLHVEPRRLDEEALGRFIAAYAPERASELGNTLRDACRGPDGTYLPILARLALLLGTGQEFRNIAELYEAAFRALLRQKGRVVGDENTELLIWAGEFCLETYWANGFRSLRYRNAPEQARMQSLLEAGVLVPDDPYVKPGQTPSQVRFFHDSMQSFLTARGLFAREHARATWDFLWKAAADPLFAAEQSELAAGTGSELFQMCLQVFGPEEKLRRELGRQLVEWAHTYDADLTKRDIVNAAPEELQTRLWARFDSHPELSPRSGLLLAIEVCGEQLPNLGTLYMRMAKRLWPHQLGQREGA